MIADASVKSDLRAVLRARRRQLAALYPDAAERAARGLPSTLSAAVVAGYHAMGAELSPWPVLRRLAKRGARIVLPVAQQLDAALIFRAWREGQPLEADAAGILSPTAEAEALRPDLVITPLLAFDHSGYRLGQGGGFYDRTLEALRRQGPVLAIGLAYAGQEVEAVPHEPHDQPLDAILTESGYHPVRKDN